MDAAVGGNVQHSLVVLTLVCADNVSNFHLRTDATSWDRRQRRYLAAILIALACKMSSANFKPIFRELVSARRQPHEKHTTND